jgi:hypothetical protein
MIGAKLIRMLCDAAFKGLARPRQVRIFAWRDLRRGSELSRGYLGLMPLQANIAEDVEELELLLLRSLAFSQLQEMFGGLQIAQGAIAEP